MGTEIETPPSTTEEEFPPLVRVPPVSEPAEAHPAALVVALVLLVFVTVFAAIRLTPPEVVGASAPAERFSGERALGALKRVLGKEPQPHPLGSAENAKVRERLIAELTTLGYEPTVQETFVNSPRHGHCGTVRNVLAEFKGTSPVGEAPTMVLLVAHYDSVASGIGASDDGSGVGALLEIARALKAGPALNHSVGFLFSDGEEAGLLGAEAFVAEHPWRDRLQCVINLEARGSRGPSLMFQTGPNNAEVVTRFAQAAPRPITGSSFTTVYEKMPNDTDFSPFRDRPNPPPGINLAYIGGVQHYHTVLDDLEHIDPRSVQHHGDSALALAKSLATTPLAESKSDAVFFDLFGFTVVRWPVAMSTPLAGLALVLVLVASLLPARGGRAARVAQGFGAGLLSFALALAGSIGVIYLIGGRLVRPDQTPWPAEPGAMIVCLLAAALTVQALVAGILGGKSGFWGAWSATWTVWAAASLGLALELPGFTFLFVVPAIAAGLVGVLAGLFGRGCRTWASAAAVAPLLVAGCLWIPTLLLMQDALGVGAKPPAITLYVFALFSTALLPCLALRSRTRHSSALVFAGLSLVLIAGLGSIRAQRYQVDPLRAAGKPPRTGRPYQLDAPRAATYAYVHDTQAGTATWLVFGLGRDLPEFLSSAPQKFTARRRRDYPWLRQAAWSAPGKPRPNAKPPVLERRTEVTRKQGRTVKAVLRSARGAHQIALILPPDAPLKAIRIGGKPALVSSPQARAWRTGGHHVYWCFTAPKAGLQVELDLTTTDRVEATLLDASLGLPSTGKVLLDLRDPLGSPWGLRGDLWVQLTQVDL